MLVLDDFDNVRSARCNDQLEFFVKHMPEKAHLVLITRADPALRLGRMRAAGQLLEIRATTSHSTSRRRLPYRRPMGSSYPATPCGSSCAD